MKAIASPVQVLDFAHALQMAHFGEGKDLNAPETYDVICKELDLPKLDTAAIAAADEADPLVASSFSRARGLGISSFPTIIVEDETGNRLGVIDGIYDKEDFISAFADITAPKP